MLLESVHVLILAFLIRATAKDLKDLVLICKSLGSEFASEHSSSQRKWRHGTPPLPSEAQFLIKDSFLTTCHIQRACMP